MTSRMKEEFETQFKEFFKERRRWKGDFEVAINRATNGIDQFNSSLDNCLAQGEANTQTVKLLLDAQMIGQLISRNSIEGNTAKEKIAVELGNEA